MRLPIGAEGLGLRVFGVGFRVEASKFMVQDLRFGAERVGREGRCIYLESHLLGIPNRQFLRRNIHCMI